MKYWPVLLLAFFLLAIPAGADVFEIKVNKTGSSFIWWWWENTNDPNCTKTIFLDNQLESSNTSVTNYIASDLNANEQHSLTINLYNVTLNTYNGTNTSTTKTYEQDVWLPLYITLAFIVIGWFTFPMLIYVGIIPAFYGLTFVYLQTQQSYIVFLYGFMVAFTILAAGFRTYYG